MRLAAPAAVAWSMLEAFAPRKPKRPMMTATEPEPASWAIQMAPPARSKPPPAVAISSSTMPEVPANRPGRSPARNRASVAVTHQPPNSAIRTATTYAMPAPCGGEIGRAGLSMQVAASSVERIRKTRQAGHGGGGGLRGAERKKVEGGGSPPVEADRTGAGPGAP